MISRRHFGLMTAAAAGALAAPAVLRATRAAAQGRARNVILMISDGAGFHTWTAASFYRHGALGQEVYDAFPVRTLMTTYPLNTARAPTRDMARKVSYEAAKAWSTAPGKGDLGGEITKKTYANHFAGYDYVKRDYVDSAAAGTALSAGVKTYNNAINWSNDDKPLRNLGQMVKSAGKALGVVTSVQVSHATPAVFYANNVSRNNYAAIGSQLVEEALCDVIMGAGHPLFDHNGRYAAPTANKAFQYVGGPDAYVKLTTGQTAYHLIENKADFEKLAAGRLEMRKDKLYGLAQVANTLQYQRGIGSGYSGDDAPMGGFIETVPSLETMTKGALAFLGSKPAGFFLMVEGGAVDWAAHANHTGRLIEEQIDFNRSIEAAVAWIEANGGFGNTLLIVTTDHGNGIAYGPESDVFAFQPVVNRGKGNLPGVRWHYDNHTNELVPVWANGPGADQLVKLSTGEDMHTGLVGWGSVSRYHDNTDVARVIAAVLGAS
jgi:alkaline phosphatase